MDWDSEFDLRLQGDVGHLVLNRPERRNALNRAMWRALPGLLEQARAAPTKVLIVSGAKGHFAAGADISEFEEVYASRESTLAYFGEVAAAMEALANFEKPTIALIEGACVGGGLGLALCCDLRIAADTARLGITPGKLGLMYSLSDTRRLVEAVGPSKAKDILFTGRILDGEEAWTIGLVDELHGAGALAGIVQSKAELIAGASQWSARKAKLIVRRILDGQVADDAETDAWMADAVEGADFREGRDAFLQKRAPKFPYR